MKTITFSKQTWITGGMIVVSIPKEIVDKLGIKPRELVEIKLTKLEEE